MKENINMQCPTMEATKLEALSLVMQQMLKADEDDYRLYDVHVSEFRSDAKGALGLRTSRKQLVEHDAKKWMSSMVFAIAENLEESYYAGTAEQHEAFEDACRYREAC